MAAQFISNKLSKIAQVLLISTVAIAAVMSRFYQISAVPAALSHDEMVYALNAYSVAITGRGITGEWQPLSLTPMHLDFAELPSTLMAPFYLLPISSLLATKLPFILMSLILPILLGCLAYRLSNSKISAYATGFIALFNPWIWQFGRLSFDAYWSMFFIVAATAVFISAKNWHKLYALPLFFLSFYQYQGHKLVFLPWVMVWGLYILSSAKSIRQKLPTIVVMTLAASLFAFYLLFQLPKQSSAKRLDAIVSPSHELIKNDALNRRRLSLDSPLTRFAVNSYTVYVGHLAQRYSEVFNPRFLFIEGQANNSSFAVWNHGIFYVIDAILIALGLAAVVMKKSKKLLLLFGAGLLIAPLPAILADSQWYIFRSSLIIPFFLILMGFGATQLFLRLPKVIFALFVALYLMSIARFGYVYFTQYPILSANRHFFIDKIMSNYLSRISTNQRVMIFSNEAEFSFKAYIFYNNLLNKKTAPQIQQAFLNEKYSYNNINFTKECFDLQLLESQDAIYILRNDVVICAEEENIPWGQLEASQAAKLSDHISFADVKDSGEVYAIFDDPVCQDQELGSYLRINKLEQLHPNNLSDKVFCKTWLTDLRSFGLTNQNQN